MKEILTSLLIITAIALAIGSMESEEEVAERERAEDRRMGQRLDQCKEDLRDSISRSCESDPVFSYCSLNYESYEIPGSGCTSRVKNRGSYSDQVAYCKKQSLGSVNQSCAIEVYGCVAATGDINC